MKILSLILLFLSAFGFAQTEATLINGNSKLHYKTVGKGKPILIINGGPGMNCEGFSAVAKELAAMHYQTILYDQRGTGQSVLEKTNSETVTMDLMVQDMESLRKHLKIKSWTVFGHSFGGLLAAHYATRHPEKIDKLIFSSSGGINMKFTSYVQQRLNTNLTQTERDSLRYYQSKMDNGDESAATRKKRAQFLANAYVFDKAKAPIIAERLTQTNYKINGLVFENLRKIKFDCANQFQNFKQPVLVIQGKNDIITSETAQEIADAFPNSKLVLLDNCAHYGWLDAKELYFKSIQQFLNLEP